MSKIYHYTKFLKDFDEHEHQKPTQDKQVIKVPNKQEKATIPDAQD